MRKSTIGFAAVLACACATSAPAYASTTLTFEYGATNNIYSSPLTAEGYQFGNYYDFHIIQGGYLSTPNNGTDVLSVNGGITITKVDGGTFEMLSVDAANSGSREEPSPTISIYGYLNGALTGTIETSITDSFTTLDTTGLGVVDTLDFDGGSWPLDGIAIDNVVLTDAIPPVPEPSTWALMLLGFFGICIAARRSRKSRVPQLA